MNSRRAICAWLQGALAPTLATAAAVLLALPGCKPGGVSLITKYGAPDTFIFARGSDAQKLDPADVDDGESVNTLVQICEGLVRFRSDTLEIEPCLATRWETSPDGLTYTFHLREGVRFHDGTPLSAEAAAWSFLRQMDPAHPGHLPGALFQYWGNLYQDIVEVRPDGPLTLVLRLRQPSAGLLSSLAIIPAALLSPRSLADHGEAFARHPVGTGPYRFVSWSPNQAIVLEANPDYWDTANRPGIRRLIFKVVPENSVRLLELKSGRIFGLDGVQPAELAAVAGDTSFTIHRGAGLNVGYLTFNLSRPRWRDPEVRLAFGLAIDRAQLAALALEGAGRVADYPVPPGFLGIPDPPDPVPHNPARAREILARHAADFAEPVRLQVMTAPRPFLPDPVKAASFIRSQLEAVGVRVEIVARDFKSHLDSLRNFDFDCAIIGWIGDNGDSDNFLSVLFGSWATQPGVASNFAGYRNPEMDELLLAARREVDVAQRRQLYERALALWRRDLPIIPLVHGDVVVVLRREVTGFRVQKTGDLWFGSVGWKTE
jgi:peptide/nickel transport system substrate-binding protein